MQIETHDNKCLHRVLPKSLDRLLLYTHLHPLLELMKLVSKLVATLPCVIRDEGDGLTLSPTSAIIFL
jgi:hypothetical protein